MENNLENTEDTVNIEKYGWSAITFNATGIGCKIGLDIEELSKEIIFDRKPNIWSKLNPFKRKQKFVPNNLYTDGKNVIICKSDRYFGIHREHVGYFTGVKLIGDFKDEASRCEGGYLKSNFKQITEEELIFSGKYYQVGARYERNSNGDIVEVVNIMPNMSNNIKCKILSSKNKQSIGCTQCFSGGLKLVGYAINRHPTQIAEPFSCNEIFMSQKLGIIVTSISNSGVLTDKFDAVVINVFDGNSRYKAGQFIPQIYKKDFVYMTQKRIQHY